MCKTQTCTRIQRRGEFQEHICPRCHYQCKLEALAADEESSDPGESDDFPDHYQSEESDDFLNRQTWLTASDDALATHQPIQLGIARQNGLSAGNEGTWKQTKEEI